MRREHTNVCAHCKLRIIIREATAWPLQMRREHTNVCAHCKLRIIIRAEGHCKCDGNTPTCVSTVSFELLSGKQRHGRCKCERKHTNVCARCKLRIIIRETTAWPLELRRDVPTVSSELLSEKQRHGNCNCDGKHTNVCARWKLRIIIRETTAWPLEMRRETHQRVCPM
jgi:hypothetical protein